jgi:hypothetical protein
MKNYNPNAETCASQKAQILAHLQSGRSITTLQALKLYGCFRLSGRIHELQKDGHSINSNLIPVKGGKHVAEYTLNPVETRKQKVEG